MKTTTNTGKTSIGLWNMIYFSTILLLGILHSN